MNPPRKNPTKSREELTAFLTTLDQDPSVTGSTAWHEKKVSPAPGSTELSGCTQILLPPERWYPANLWPWYLRGPFCAWLRNWYARRHPEIFGEDYQ